jgi:hypothetical protein
MEISIAISGLSPVIMHCGQTADPLNPFAKAMKKCSGKRSKTDDDLAVLSTLEWWAGLYLDAPAKIAEDFSVSCVPTARLEFPAHVIDSCLREGARKVKLGKQASAGCIVTGPAKLTHDGPKNINDLALNERHSYRTAVKVGQAKVMRNRPIFPVWSASFSVEIDESVIDAEQIMDAMRHAGKLVGIGDWRPGAPRGGYYGRFEVS